MRVQADFDEGFDSLQSNGAGADAAFEADFAADSGTAASKADFGVSRPLEEEDFDHDFAGASKLGFPSTRTTVGEIMHANRSANCGASRLQS